MHKAMLTSAKSGQGGYGGVYVISNGCVRSEAF